MTFGKNVLNPKLPSYIHLNGMDSSVFKVDRPQTTVVAKNLSVLQLFISRMPKMCAILQLVSAPLNPYTFDLFILLLRGDRGVKNRSQRLPWQTGRRR